MKTSIETSTSKAEAVSLHGVTTRSTVRSYRIVRLHGTRGTVETYYYRAADADKAVLYAGHVATGFESPAVHMYKHTAEDMQNRHVSGLRIRFRDPDDQAECLHDLLLGIAFLRQEAHQSMAMAAYSHAVSAAVDAVNAAPELEALAMLSPMLRGPAALDTLGNDIRVLFIHGGRDTDAPIESVRETFRRFEGPKEFVTLPLSRHGLDENSTEAQLRLRNWLQAWNQGEDAASLDIENDTVHSAHRIRDAG
jgi:pimeloyl-ACP methyl ester carboxylesterase